MVDIVDPDLLEELCRKHHVPFELALKIISDFTMTEESKKRYIRQIIEEWENVDKEVDS
jgi:hypothetical protein